MRVTVTPVGWLRVGRLDMRGVIADEQRLEYLQDGCRTRRQFRRPRPWSLAQSSRTPADSDPIAPAVPDLADDAVGSVAPADRPSG